MPGFSVAKLFSSAPPAAPAAPVPAQPGNIPPEAGTPVAPVGNAEPNGVVPAVETSKSPLDPYKEMWEPIKTEATPDGLPVALDPAKLQEVIGKADFSKVLNPENLAAITAGGEGAVAALVETLNATSRQVLTQATLASNQMIQQAVTGYSEAQAANLPNLMKAQGLSDSLSAANPLFTNPAVVPIIDAVKSQLAAKNPNASVAELTTMAQEFVSVIGEQFAPKPAADPNAPPTEKDWSKFA